MPFVHIELVAGRTVEQKINLVKEVTEAVVKNTDAPSEKVHVILNEMQPENYAVNGELLSQK
ncbi:4-oxalocrotonate tautomerase [Carnobacterium iners]|uniref:Tautomerase n=2 Tax=Carnobacterium iners TaxID=1073423 RepID=A0A1X7MSP1_9LACT|nr:4-oxalocrotonate tautomerase [Carnobacterium iners]SMH27147.1 4-oxalocrotonate tautomerase [Carnobacterium iners]